MRIVSANVQHGRPDPPGRPALGSAMPVLRALGPDVCALQELDRGRWRTRWRHQGDEVAAALDGVLVWAPAKRRWWAAQGNALVVRGSVAEQEVLELPGSGERRTAAVAEVGLAGARWTVACTHLSLDVPTARRQLALLLAALGEHPAPRVLAGDLNLESHEVGPLAEAAGYRWLPGAPTVDARAVPRRRLDHVLVQAAVLGAGGVAKLPVSDHLAVWADVRVAPPS